MAKYDFVMTLGMLPPNRLAEEQYQGLAWRFLQEDKKWSLLHFPAAQLSATSKEDLLKEVTTIVSDLYDRIEKHFPEEKEDKAQ